MMKGRYIASFVGQEPVSATFAGMYRVGGWQTLDHASYEAFPGNAELGSLGMTGRTPGMPDCLAFHLEPLPNYAKWIGRLVITWPKPYQKWCGGRMVASSTSMPSCPTAGSFVNCPTGESWC